jgi:cell migration-inducing and hyaluronan-binding protein
MLCRKQRLGVDVMSTPFRSSLLASLVPAVLLAGLSAVAEAQDAGSVNVTRWSDPATWPDRKVPKAGDKVTIEKDRTVVLDTSPPPLNGLTIEGKLVFSNDRDLELVTEWIMLHGALEIGTPAHPHTSKAIITFTDNVKGEDIMSGMGDRGIMISGGTLSLHGDRTHTWTRLARTAEAGSTTIEVLDAYGWRAGDEIVLASTDFDPRQAERRTIRAINGNTLTLDRPLAYMHFGKITFGVDERGEVGLLTRNIVIRASDDAEQSYFGGHIMAMPTSRMYISGVELYRMGQHLTLARYPVHWHLIGDADGQYIRNSAIHDTYNRCVTVHGTNNLRIENNVTYNTVGHCFFLEDGIETGNWYVRNLGIQTKCHPTKACVPTNLAADGEGPRQNGQSSKDVLIPSDNTVATYWITNPNNHYIDNVAAGSDANGFWLSLPEHPTGAFDGTELSKTIWPRRTKLGVFKGNVAHSNYDGFMFDRNAGPDGRFSVTGSSHMPKENPQDPSSRTLESHFEDLTAYKNRNGGVWGRGEMHVFRNLRAADNAIGYTHASGSAGRDPFTSLVIDSLFVGETENVGNPRTPDEQAQGRSLPKPQIPDFPIRGYEYYDYRHDVVNTTFVNYADNPFRKAGALSYLLYTSAGVSTENAIAGARFVNAKPVYFPPFVRKWGNDVNLGNVAWKTAAFHDLDGSVGGIPNAYVLIHDGEFDSIATDEEACVIKRDWNAAVCRGDVGRLTFGGPVGPRGAGPGAAPGGAPRPGASPGAVAPAPPVAGAATPGAGGVSGLPPVTPITVTPGSRTQQPPVTLSRNGRDYVVTQSNVRAGTEIRVTTERPSLALTLSEMDAGSWVLFELPGFTKAEAGVEVRDLDALRKSRETAYYKAKDALWVKVVSNGVGATGPRGGGPGGGTSVPVSK